MPRLISPERAIFANPTVGGPTDTWIPMTGALAARGIDEAKFGVWLGGLTDIDVQPAYEFSDDGVDWSGTVYKKNMTVVAAKTRAPEWTWGDQTTWFTIPDTGVGETGGAYVRFGVNATTPATAGMRYGLGRIQIGWRSVHGRSIACAPVRVWTSNADTFVPLTGPVAASDVAEVRAELELSGIVSGITVQPGWQQVNDPGVDTDWGTPTVFGTPRTTNAFFAATAFAAAAPTKRSVRFGLKVTGTGILSCIARARFDWR